MRLVCYRDRKFLGHKSKVQRRQGGKCQGQALDKMRPKNREGKCKAEMGMLV